MKDLIFIAIFLKAFWNDANCAAELAFICEKSNRSFTPQPEVVLPLNFNNGRGVQCPIGYSTFGGNIKNPNEFFFDLKLVFIFFHYQL
jgi:hypothetical protein